MGYWKESTKVVKKTFEEYGELEVTIRKFNAVHEHEIMKAMANMQMVGGIQRGNVDIGLGKMTTVMLGITKAPFPHKSVDEIKQMPSDVYNWIYDEINEYNPSDTGKKSKSGRPSDTEQKTQN